MINPVLNNIETPAETRTLLYDRLGYRNMLDAGEMEILSAVVGNDFTEAICPFIITFQGSKSFFYDNDIQEAIRKLLLFLPFSVEAKEEITISLGSLIPQLSAVGDKKRFVCRKDNPVAYFFKKAFKLSGFDLLGMSARNMILDEGPHIIPALLVACTVIQEGTKHYNLRGEDILETKIYLKKGGSVLSQATQDGYTTILNRLIVEIKKLYCELGYGSTSLFLEAEQIELAREDKKRQKIHKNLQGPKVISEPSVLKPHTLKYIILKGQPPKISNAVTYNRLIRKMLTTIIVHFGSKLSDLLIFIIRNLEINEQRIKFPIKADRLLKEEVAYVPLPDGLCIWIVMLLEYRQNISPFDSDDPLFAVQKDSHFFGLDAEMMKLYFASLSNEVGVKITERILYETHRSYYKDFGELNPIITDRISNRMEPAVLMPRMYSCTSLGYMRTAHGAAFDKVCKSIGVHYGS